MPPHTALPRQDGTPPSATPTGHASHEPKIGGSEAAFIVVVILLAAIVVASSTGIYFLLRNGEPSDADRAARRRKYSIRRHGVRAHPLPIGLPGSLSEKIGSIFKGRRAGAGWVPARGDEDPDPDEWDTTDEPLRERHDDNGGGGDVALACRPQQQQQRPRERERSLEEEEHPRIVSVPASLRASLTEVTTDSAHKSRSASHVAAESSASFGRGSSPDALVHVLSFPTEEPDEEWLDARGTRSGVGGLGANSITNVPGPLTPRPRRADSEHEITLFAGSTPFRDV
ncbi:hypothetical protein F5148DRAFT_838238 [Russula earlei]|uniref:Uncharacterized protein n=1 Tax=Russula earlei TaxID=71964 RepID=A0ACC0UB88_9AGAM|nr:hypothetical protein F5148DRAFT_838238 [Russula earlei]